MSTSDSSGSSRAVVDDSGKIGLASAIESLRHELQVAMEAGAGAPVRFEVGPVELEMTVVAEGTKKGEVGVGWWIFSAKAGIDAKDAATHRLKLSLTPKRRTEAGQDEALQVTGKEGKRPE